MCVLTEESQIGKLAKDLAETAPNPMVNGHQAWLDGLTKAVKIKQPALKKQGAGCFRIMSRLSIQFYDFSVFRNIHAAFNALTAYKFTHIGAADGGMIHGIHVYGDDFGFRHDLAGF